MSYEPLHHKYRPQTFANLVGQEAIATTLTNAIRTERIAPAYLFTGPRGTGKTSSARILTKSLNCKKQDKPTESPCGVCEVCTSIASGSALDVIEIDAASNTGVDNIREIIERAQFAPVQCRYKVYIIDEVHMLSTAAFNALLKTLEEPPARVVFVLATTDPQRVLPTIISRCQRFDFRRIPLEAMVKHLSDIASKENINITSDAITLVAQVAQGGLRDAESLLDQLSLLPGEVTVEAVWDLVGAVPERDLMDLTKAIASDNSETVLDHCRRLMDRGREPLVVLQNLAGFYLNLLIAKTAPNRSDLVAVTPPTWKQLCEFAQPLDDSRILFWSQHLKNSEAQIKNTTQPRLWLEVTLLGLLPSANFPQPASKTGQLPLQQSQVSRQELQTDREPGLHSTAVTPPISPGKTLPSQTLALRHKIDRESDSVAVTAPFRSSEKSRQQPPTPAINTFTNGFSEIPSQVPPDRAPTTLPPEPTPPVCDRAVGGQHPTVVVHEASRSELDTQSAGLEVVWQEVLAHVPPFTQGLLQTKGCLLTFDGSVACVGISSSGLLKLALSKVPDIEAAFEAVYKSKVKVTLQANSSTFANTVPTSGVSVSEAGYSSTQAVATSPTSSQNTDVPGVVNSPRDYSRAQTAQRSAYRRVSPEPSGTAANEQKSQSTLIEETPQAEVKRLTTNSSLTLAGREVLSELQPQAQVETDRGSFTTAVNHSPISLPIQEVDSDGEEVERALKELKQVFEGEFVDLADEFSNPESRITDQLPGSQTIDAGTYQPEQDPEEYWEEQDSIEQAATHQMQSTEIAAFDHTQTQLRLKNLQYDEDGDIAF